MKTCPYCKRQLKPSTHPSKSEREKRNAVKKYCNTVCANAHRAYLAKKGLAPTPMIDKFILGL